MDPSGKNCVSYINTSQQIQVWCETNALQIKVKNFTLSFNFWTIEDFVVVHFKHGTKWKLVGNQTTADQIPMKFILESKNNHDKKTFISYY